MMIGKPQPEDQKPKVSDLQVQGMAATGMCDGFVCLTIWEILDIIGAYSLEVTNENTLLLAYREFIMKLSASCMNCLVQRQMENISKFDDEELKSNYMRKILSVISEAHENETAPVIIAKINRLHQEYFGLPYSFESLKKQYNFMMLPKEEYIWNKILSSEDSLLEALKYARAGNYIDFGAMGSIDDDKLTDLLESVHQENIESSKYQEFIKDLRNARELVYLTDNCGEVVLDKLFIKCIINQFPNIHITVIVRGKMVLNDATMEDARMVGLMEISDVIGNGTEIAGTCLEQINHTAKECIEAADVIISKGQGNFETLNGCGLNIYYLFLCKCEWFVKRFKLEQFKGVFINESDLFLFGLGA